MFSLRTLTEEAVEEEVKLVENADYNYPDLEITKQRDPKGYTVDHNRIQLGEGEAHYEKAVEAVRNWKMFDLGWVRQVRSKDKVPIEPGVIAAVSSAQLGLHTLCLSRIIYTIDDTIEIDSQKVKRFGFAYGTLPTHVEAGEERFLIEWNQATDEVWYDVLAFSKPYHILTKIGYFYARMCQKAFGRDTKRVMRETVQGH